VAILERQQGARGVLFEAPHVAKDPTDLLANADPGATWEIIIGDPFQRVPASCDLHIRPRVLHGMSDE